MSHCKAAEPEKEENFVCVRPHQEEVATATTDQCGCHATIVSVGDRIGNTKETHEPDEGEEGETLDDGRRKGTFVEEEDEIGTGHFEEGDEKGCC